MQKPIPIHWKDFAEFPMNIFSRNLHSRMLTTHKYRAEATARRSPTDSKKIYLVEYDKDYVLCWLLKKVLVPFAHLPEKEVIQLIKEAYKYESE